MPSSSENPEVQAVLIQQLSENLKATTELIQKLTDEMRTHAIAQASFKAELGSLHENVSTLLDIVRDGNGKSLITRFALLENRLDSMSKTLNDFIQSITNTKTGEERENTRGRWQLIAALAGGLCGIIGGLFALLKG